VAKLENIFFDGGSSVGTRFKGGNAVWFCQRAAGRKRPPSWQVEVNLIFSRRGMKNLPFFCCLRNSRCPLSLEPFSLARRSAIELMS
jgi:hypothetical protein